MWNIDYPRELCSESALNIAFPIKPLSEINDCPIENSHQKIRDLYYKYDISKGAPSTELQDDPKDHKISSSLYKAFEKTQEKRPLSFIRNRLKTAARDRKCPYCGIGEISALDHYLPRKNYKNFSIHTPNLIPCCQICNNKKSAIANLETKNQFLHAYYNKLNNTAILHAKITITPNGYSISFMTIVNAHNYSNKVKYQFDKLELSDRLDAEVNDFIFNQINALKYIHIPGTTKLIVFFAEQYLHAQKTYKHNHWITAVWRAFLQCSELCKIGPECLTPPRR